jgi:hypothetical protein
MASNHNPNCFLGVAISAARCCKPRWDKWDTIDGLMADTVFGGFEGGYPEYLKNLS